MRLLEFTRFAKPYLTSSDSWIRRLIFFVTGPPTRLPFIHDCNLRLSRASRNCLPRRKTLRRPIATRGLRRNFRVRLRRRKRESEIGTRRRVRCHVVVAVGSGRLGVNLFQKSTGYAAVVAEGEERRASRRFGKTSSYVSSGSRPSGFQLSARTQIFFAQTPFPLLRLYALSENA